MSKIEEIIDTITTDNTHGLMVPRRPYSGGYPHIPPQKHTPVVVPHSTSQCDDTIFSVMGRLAMISMRLRRPSSLIPQEFEDLHTVLSKDKVFVLIVTKGELVSLVDDASMFPSDTLITQIRLLMD
jgi:hypothetical protein